MINVNAEATKRLKGGSVDVNVRIKCHKEGHTIEEITAILRAMRDDFDLDFLIAISDFIEKELEESKHENE